MCWLSIVLALRVDWFRARAAKTRSDEEINLLLAEARAHRRGLKFAANLYREAADALPAYRCKGATAYALEKADMYARMSEDCHRRVSAAYAQYQERMRTGAKKAGTPGPPAQGDKDEEDLRVVFKLTQGQISLSDDRVDYSIVSPCHYPASAQRPDHLS